MPGFLSIQKTAGAAIFQRMPGDDRNAVVALLSAQHAMAVAQPGKTLGYHQFGWRLQFLKTKNIRSILLKKPTNEVLPEPN